MYKTVKAKLYKLLEYNIREYIYDLRVEKGF